MKKTISPVKSIQVGEQVFNWHIYRQSQWCTVDGWKGLAVHVELADESQRELILEFPFKIKNRRSTPQKQRPSVSEKDVTSGISAAINAGWNPESRGKAFVFEIEDDN